MLVDGAPLTRAGGGRPTSWRGPVVKSRTGATPAPERLQANRMQQAAVRAALTEARAHRESRWTECAPEGRTPPPLMRTRADDAPARGQEVTMTDSGLLAASAAAILTVAAYWWRRAPETARIVATEVGWQVGSSTPPCTCGPSSPVGPRSVWWRSGCPRWWPSGWVSCCPSLFEGH